MLLFFVILFKFVAIALTGALGILALFVEFRDKSGKVTKLAKVTISAIVISALVSATVQSLEFLSADLDSRAAAAESLQQVRRTETILTGIERILQPLEAMNVSATLEIPTDLEGLDAFRHQLETLAEAIRSNEVIVAVVRQ